MLRCTNEIWIKFSLQYNLSVPTFCRATTDKRCTFCSLLADKFHFFCLQIACAWRTNATRIGDNLPSNQTEFVGYTQHFVGWAPTNCHGKEFKLLAFGRQSAFRKRVEIKNTICRVLVYKLLLDLACSKSYKLSPETRHSVPTNCHRSLPIVQA